MHFPFKTLSAVYFKTIFRHFCYVFIEISLFCAKVYVSIINLTHFKVCDGNFRKMAIST